MNIRPMGPAPMTTMVSPGCAPVSFEPLHHAGERLGERGVLQRHAVRDQQRVLLHDARGDAHVLGVGAVVEEQVFAEVLLAVPAEEAVVAGRGVHGDDAVADGETW